MEYLSVDNLRFFHKYAIDSGARDEQALRDAVRDEGTLHHICRLANNEEDPIRRAALLLHHISTMHPFVEGNKRTALLAAEDAIGSGHSIDSTGDELNDFIRSVASGQEDLGSVEEWLKKKIVFRD